MKETIERARRAARERLWEMGYEHHNVDIEGRCLAVAAYIRSLVRDQDLGYLTELLVEHNDGSMLKVFTLLAQALETGSEGHDCALGAYLTDLASTYLADEIDAVVEALAQEEAA